MVVKDPSGTPDDDSMATFATWIAIAGMWGGEPVINAVRVVGFAVEQLRVVRDT